VSIRKLPLPSRERGRVRGIKMEALGILNHYHPHPSLPHRRGRGKGGFPDENELKK